MGAMLQTLIQSLIKAAPAPRCDDTKPSAAQPRKTSGPVARDLTGKTFGWLTVLYQGETVNRSRMWMCRCVCGEEKLVLGHNLTAGRTRSCGCSRASHKAG